MGARVHSGLWLSSVHEECLKLHRWPDCVRCGKPGSRKRPMIVTKDGPAHARCPKRGRK